MTCTATTKAGRRCTRRVLRGGEVCHAHSGARVGRPSALTPEVRERLVQAARAGASGRMAALAAGISETTLYELLRRGRAEESGPHRELLEAIERARGEASLHAMASWRRDMGTPGNWRASVAYLDRVERGRFAWSSTIEPGPTSPPQGPRPDLSRLSEEALAELESLYADPEPDGEGE